MLVVQFGRGRGRAAGGGGRTTAGGGRGGAAGFEFGVGSRSGGGRRGCYYGWPGGCFPRGIIVIVPVPRTVCWLRLRRLVGGLRGC